MDQTDPPILLPDHTPRNNRNYSIVLAENTLPTKGNELTDLAREEIGTDFIPDTGKPAASRLQRFFLFLMLVLTLGMVYYYFPRPSVPVELKNEISFKDLAGSCEKRFEKTARTAQDDWEKARYYACVEKLQPVIAELQKDGLQKQNVRNNQCIFALYLDSILQIRKASMSKEDESLLRNAQNLVREMVRHDPDVVQWRLLEIDLCYDLQLFNMNAPAASDKKMVECIDEVLEKLSGVRRMLEKTKNEDRQLEVIDFRRAQLLVRRWKSAAKKLSHDDYGDPGVENREEAYRIAAKYDHVVDFLKLRKYIVDTIYMNNSGYYYWRGEKLWRRKFLDEERKALKAKIEAAEKGKGGVK